MKKESSIIKWSVALLLLVVLDLILAVLLYRSYQNEDVTPDRVLSTDAVSNLQSTNGASESQHLLQAQTEAVTGRDSVKAEASKTAGASETAEATGKAATSGKEEATETAEETETTEDETEAAQTERNSGGRKQTGGAVQTAAGSDAGDLPLFLDKDDEEEGGSSTAGGNDSQSSTKIDQLVAGLTTEEKVAQLFFITPEALTGSSQVTQAGETTQECFSQYPVGGIIYFQQNIVSESQFTAMLSSMQSISESRIGLPVFTGVDEEGGSVTRIANRGVADTGGNIPSMQEIGQTGDSQAAYDVSMQIGTYLKRMGVTVDFAPVADVHSDVDTLIGDRSFSSDPDVAADMVSESVKGFHDAGVLCTLKHFPGHGSASGDSHSDQVVVNKSLEELKNEDFVPFQAGIDAGADFVLMGHLSCPNVLDSSIPASLSYRMVTEILRGQLGFDGVVITDAMNMGAVANYYSSGEAAVKAISAGVDMVLMPVDFEAAYQAVLQAVQDGTVSTERLDESVRRILSAKMGEG